LNIKKFLLEKKRDPGAGSLKFPQRNLSAMRQGNRTIHSYLKILISSITFPMKNNWFPKYIKRLLPELNE
jgi:hypothetical protein